MHSDWFGPAHGMHEWLDDTMTLSVASGILVSQYMSLYVIVL